MITTRAPDGANKRKPFWIEWALEEYQKVMLACRCSYFMSFVMVGLKLKKNLSLIGIYSVSDFWFWNIRQIIGCQSDIWSVWWCEKSTKKQIQDHGRFITHGLWTCQKLTFQTTLNNLRSWIPDNHCYLTTKSDTKQRSQFLQFNDFFCGFYF